MNDQLAEFLGVLILLGTFLIVTCYIILGI